MINEIAKQIRDVHFRKNWTSVSLKDALAELTWEQATTKIENFNTIAALVFHVNYFVKAVLKVLNGKALDSHDKYSFNCPPIESQKDWEDLLKTVWDDGEEFARLVEKLPESKLWEDFWDNKYGSYYRNIQGVIEHFHYHLGQIVLIKKILLRDQ